MFKYVVGEYNMKTGVRIWNSACIRHPAFVQHGIALDTRIQIDTADLRCHSPEIHLLHDAGAGTKIQNDCSRSQMAKDPFAKETIVPVPGLARIKSAIESLNYAAQESDAANSMETRLTSMISSTAMGAGKP